MFTLYPVWSCVSLVMSYKCGWPWLGRQAGNDYPPYPLAAYFNAQLFTKKLTCVSFCSGFFLNFHNNHPSSFELLPIFWSHQEEAGSRSWQCFVFLGNSLFFYWTSWLCKNNSDQSFSWIFTSWCWLDLAESWCNTRGKWESFWGAICKCQFCMNFSLLVNMIWV